MIRFDAYSATMKGPTHQDLVKILVDSSPTEQVGFKQGKGFFQFAERLSTIDASGSEFGSVQWGGRHGDRVMIEVKGEASPKAVEALRSAFHHRVTRVDSCADFDAPGAFERLLAPCIEVKQAHKLKGSKAGDWDDFPEDGRTMYIGATSSAVRVRLYEKGKQPEYLHLNRENWARIEVQARPAKEAKAAFSHLSPVQVWGSSGWTRKLAGMVLQEHVDAHPAGTTYKRTELDTKLQWLCKQYGATLLDLLENVGSWECAGLTLGEIISEQKRRQKMN